MAVIAYREVMPRAFQHRFGESPTAERKFIVTVDQPTPHGDIIAAINILHGSAHPEYSYLLMLDASLAESDRHHVEVAFRYEATKTDFEANPLARADVWSFSTGGAAVPAFFYYHGTGNSDVRQLVNSAGDFMESAMTEEAEVRCTISGNRASFPLAAAALVTNSINNAPYLGGDTYTWKCNGISAQQAVEVVGGVEIRYWQISVELAYRQSGWRLRLPNIGWNYKDDADGGKKKRCYVLHQGEEIPSANQMALNEDGSINFNTNFDGSGAAAILTRRVHPAVNFQTYFGTPPF